MLDSAKKNKNSFSLAPGTPDTLARSPFPAKSPPASNLTSISGLAEEAVKTSQFKVEHRTLPYPTRQYIPEYRSKLGTILSELSL